MTQTRGLKTEGPRRSLALERWLPDGAVAYEWPAPPHEPACPELDLGLRTITHDDRRQDFAVGRACARACCEALGFSHVLIGSDDDGAPVWPNDLVGSITHCDGYAAAVAAPAQVVKAIGLDAEPARPLPNELAGMIASDNERDLLNQCGNTDLSTRLLYSIKEAVFKAVWPYEKTWLEFEDIELASFKRPDLFTCNYKSRHTIRQSYGHGHIGSELILSVAYL